MIYPSKFNILPVKDKKPLVEWKAFTEREQTPQEKQEITALSQNGNSLGFITGKVSGIFVLDIDGFEGYDEIRKRGLIIPKTWQSKTPRGLHYYFKWVPELDGKVTTKTEVLPKVDTRGDGGYVVFYGWQEPRFYLSNPPKWLIDMLPTREQTPKLLGNEQEDTWLLSQLEAVKPGQGKEGRTPTFVRVIGRLKNHGLSSSEIQGLLYPWAVKYNYENRITPLVEDQFKRYPPPKTDDGEAVSLSEVLAEDLKTEWLIDPQIISKQSISFVAGLPEACKTWILMDMALALSSGDRWLKFKCRKSKVIYLDQERARASTIDRFNRLIRGRGLSPDDLNDTLLLKPQSRVKLDLPHSFNAFVRTLEKFQPDVVLVDSFKKFHSKNELASQDMQFIFTKLEEIKDKFGCSFVFIHHEPKGVIQKRKEDFEVRATDASGTIDFQQTSEHFFNVIVKAEPHTSMVYHTKNNLGDKQLPILVKIADQDESKTVTRVEAY